METVSVLLMGAAYVATPGPIAIETVRHGVHGGLRGALAVQAGSLLGLLFHAAFSLAGTKALQQSAAWQPFFGLAAMALLIFLGLSVIRQRHQLLRHADSALPPARNALASGALLSLASPLDLLFWLSFGGAMWSRQGHDSPVAFAAFAAGCLLASLALALFAAYCQSRLSARGVRAISLICGLALIAFGLQLGLGVAAGAIRSALAAQTNYRLSGPLAPDGGVLETHLSADGQLVGYVAWSPATQAEDLYVVPLDGSTPARQLNDPQEVGGFVVWPRFTPDGSRVVYQQFDPVDFDNRLYTITLDPGAVPVPLHGPPAGSGVQSFVLTPDGSHVVYKSQQDNADTYDLYSVPADASAPAVKLNGTLVNGGNIQDFVVSPDGSRVVFRADYREDEVFELGSVPVDGSAPPIRLNGPLVSGGDVFGQYEITPDSSRVVFLADAVSDNVVEIASVPIDRSQPPTVVNEPFFSGGGVDRFAIAPDGSRVLFLADFQTVGVYELLSAPVDGSQSPVRINQDLVSSGDVFSFFEFTPDSSQVLFLADHEGDERQELFMAPLDGSHAPQKLNGPLVADGFVSFFRVSPDGARAAYSAEQDTADVLELFSVPLDGSAAPQKLNGSLEDGSDVAHWFNFSPDGQWIAYVVINGVEDSDLYLAAAGGGSLPLQVNPPLVENGEVGALQEAVVAEIITAPGPELRMLYYADQEADELFELFVTHITPPVVRFNVTSAAIDETATVLTTTVQLEGPVLSPVQVEVALDGDAAAGSDYLLAPGVLTFVPGESSQVLEIAILPDDEVEGDETLTVTLHNPQNAVLGAPQSYTLTILDDDEEDGGGDPGDEPVLYDVYVPLFANLQENP